MRTVLFLFLFLLSYAAQAQLDDTHYFPPMKSNDLYDGISQQSFYLSTPETDAFDIEIYQGTDPTPITTLIGLSNTNSLIYSVADGTNNVTLMNNENTGIVLSNAGLRFVAPSGKKFYTNFRGKSSYHAASLTCKGKTALGKDFRWGGLANKGDDSSRHQSTCIGIYATEDNTEIIIDNYDTNCVFRLKSNTSGITDDQIKITLNANETFVLEAITRETLANKSGWLGANISATKDVAINTGGINLSVVSGYTGDVSDVGIDQIVPTEYIGTEYVFVRANGDNSTEFPVIIATKDNTKVNVNGSLFATLNDGEFIEIPGSNYSSNNAGGNMYVSTNKKVYAFQSLAARNIIYTNGMNFIPPVSCLLPKEFDQISAIEDIAGNRSAASAITIISDASIPDEDVKIFQNNIEITKNPSNPIAGTSDWKTFFVNNLTGDIKVSSDGNIAVGFFVNDGGAAGLAGYFSGFDVVPDSEVELAVEGECLPDGEIRVKDTIQPSYQWYKDGTIIPGATSFKIKMDGVGEYYADIETGSGCIYRSESIDITDPDKGLLYETCIPNRTLITQDTLQSAYQWYRNDTLLIGETDFRIDALIPGIYNTEIITSAGCVYLSDNYTVLDDIPTPDIDTTYVTSGCINEGVVKITKEDPTNYYAYQWYKDGVSIPSATSKEYIITSFGKYSTDIITPDGCVIVSDTISIQKPNLELEKDPIYGCVPNGYLKAKDSLQGSYQWYRNNIAIPGATNFKINLDSVGTYYAEIITPYGCVYKSESKDIVRCYDLEISKTANKTEILEGGDDLTYFITVENKGDLPVTNLKINEIIPSELRFKSFVASIGTWSAPYWEMANLNPGEMANLTLNTSSLPTTLDTEITNLINSTQNEVDSNFTPDDLTETVDILNGEIEVTSVNAELARPYKIIQEDILNFTFTIRNVGEILLNNIHLTNNLFPGELNGNYVGGDTNSNGVLDYDETWVYKAAYAITQPEINNLEVTSTTFTNGTQPNAFTQYGELDYSFPIDPDFVVPYIDLSVDLTGNGPGVMVDEEVNFNLNLTSDHIANVNSLNILSPLPSGFEFQSYSSNIGTYDANSGIWTINTLEKNANTTLNIKAKMVLDGEHTLNAEIVSFNELDSITANNTTSLTIKPICYRVFNEFSPNGDGINDNLVVQCTELTNQISLKIFNRNGILVFESYDYKNEFDGFGNRGLYINQNARLPNGTYYYVLNSNDIMGEKNGWIYINR